MIGLVLLLNNILGDFSQIQQFIDSLLILFEIPAKIISLAH